MVYLGNMNMIEKWVGGPKDVGAELEPKTSETIDQEVKQAREPKTIEDVKAAVTDIQELTFERGRKLEKHRDTVKELRDLGVNEYNPDTSPRTETVKDILNPIEEELVAISTEITEKREEFDLQPNREYVIKTRQLRLGELKHRAEEEFKKTPSGSNIAHIDAKIAMYFQQSDMYQTEMAKLKEERAEFFRKDKVAHNYAATIERIDHLNIQLDDMLTKANKAGYDDNGLNSI